MAFELDARLAADTLFVSDLALSQLRLMNDVRYPWLVLVPRQPGLTALDDLSADDRAVLSAELDLASRVLRRDARVARVNVASLGNIVEQLHVHVVGRWPGDPAWPGPVWGHAPAQLYAQGAAASAVRGMQVRWRELAAAPS
ncbi:MAG: HIT family protein [Pseudomonadota bacterium]